MHPFLESLPLLIRNITAFSLGDCYRFFMALTWSLASLISMGFPGGTSGKRICLQFKRIAGDAGSIPRLWRFPGLGNGNPLQYSCLKNFMDRGAWWATVPRQQGVVPSYWKIFHRKVVFFFFSEFSCTLGTHSHWIWLLKQQEGFYQNQQFPSCLIRWCGITNKTPPLLLETQSSWGISTLPLQQCEMTQEKT